MPRFDKLRAFQNVNQEEKLSLEEEHIVINGVANNSKQDSGSTIDFSSYLIEPKYSLDDVILPKNTKEQFSLMLGALKNQYLIDVVWGMAKKHKLDKALSITFYGPPGTGKTIAAEAFSCELNKKLLTVPYHLLESKYVGETPKNIVKVFEFATQHDAVIFFDEADSFLGKRLENVTQATDTAVNLTRSVMLMQLSSYQGIVVFATNLIHNYDPAFISRIRWKLQFELPDEATRAQIWQAQIPISLPIDSSVNFQELASQFDEVSGRDIKNAVLKAVVTAACEDKPNTQKRITQSHFVEAMTEIIKANKAVRKPELNNINLG